MVRHGAFSRGCQTCRKRKVKCDKASPACSQCLKAGWDCPQYGDAVERMFQHKVLKDFAQPVVGDLLNGETQPVNSSFKLVNSDIYSSSKSPIPISTIGGSLVVTNQSELYSTKLCSNIIQPVTQRAIDFFLATHVFQQWDFPRGYYEYLAALTNNAHNSQRLIASLNSVALAAYANTFRFPELLQKARQYYGRALQLLRAALTSPDESTNHSTLTSVLLLNTFNTLTGVTNQSLPPCISHIAAATSIIALNGHTLIKTQTFLPLVLQVVWGLLQTYIINSTRIPEGLDNLRQYISGALDTHYPAWDLLEMTTKVACFRADVKEGILLDTESIVKIALDLDSQLCSFAEDMPAQWLFQSIPLQQMSELVFGTCYHVYPDQWVAFIWNYLRVSRLLLHQEIKCQLGKKLTISPMNLSHLEALQCQDSTKISQRMISEICATIPQYSGYLDVLSSKQTLPETPYAHSSGKTTNGIPVIAGAFLVLWPILNAGLCTESVLQRSWIVKRTRYIGKMTGIQQAFVFADILEELKRRS